MSVKNDRTDLGQAMTELEEMLTGANAAAERMAILERLSSLEAQLRGTIAAGLSRSQFIAWQQALAAVVAAGAVVRHLPPASRGTSPSTIEGLARRAPNERDEYRLHKPDRGGRP